MRKNVVMMKMMVVAIVIFALMSVALSVGSSAGPTPIPTPAPAGSCDWTGTWQTNWGEMVLSQAGTQVSGSYTHDAGRITGTLSGSTLIGTWSEAPSYSPPNDAGDAQLTIAADCNSFTGIWGYGSTGDWSGDWTGTRTGAAPTPTPTITPTLDSDGDGVPDDKDKCSGTPAGVAVDEKGCPKYSGPESNWTVDDITPLEGKIAGVVPDAGDAGRITGETGLFDPTMDREKIEARIAEIEEKTAEEREKYRDELAQLYDQLYLLNRHEESVGMLVGGLITVTDKAMGLYTPTALVWGTSTGLTTLIMGDFKGGMNRLIGAIPPKNIGTAYSVILDVYSLCPDGALWPRYKDPASQSPFVWMVITP